jgi:F420H(2)-dependent quinone reductase
MSTLGTSRSAKPMNERVFDTVMKVVSGVHTRLYRTTGGRFGGTMRGVPVLLLDHVGRKTGQRRTTALFYMRDGENVVIVASKGGMPKDPVWWLNLKANPTTTVQIKDKVMKVRARQADAEERARLWPRLVEIYADYADYQRKTTREIPVVVLEPLSS